MSVPASTRPVTPDTTGTVANQPSVESPIRARVKVSIILSARNEQKHLRQSLNSIATQSFTDWECLIFDDGSTDDTYNIAVGYAAADRRFRVFGESESLGLAKRLNQLVLEARGSFVVRMDADDEMLPGPVGAPGGGIRYLSAADQLTTVLGGSVLLMDPNGELIGERKAPQRTTLSAREFPPVLHLTVMVSTEWFRKFPYDESAKFLRAEDSELWVRARSETTYRNVVEPVLRYRTIDAFEPARFVRSQRAMIRIGATHRAPLLLQTSGRLAVVAVSILSFDVGAVLHRSTRGAFQRHDPRRTLFFVLTVIIAFAIGLPEGPTSKRQGLPPVFGIRRDLGGRSGGNDLRPEPVSPILCARRSVVPDATAVPRVSVFAARRRQGAATCPSVLCCGTRRIRTTCRASVFVPRTTLFDCGFCDSRSVSSVARSTQLPGPGHEGKLRGHAIRPRCKQLGRNYLFRCRGSDEQPVRVLRRGLCVTKDRGRSGRVLSK